MRSRCRKKRRQSPAAIDSDRLMPKRVGSASASSIFFISRERARSTSAAVIGCFATPVSSVASAASRAASIGSVSGTCAVNVMKPGSKSSGVQPPTLLAFFVSTSALYRRPAGAIVRMRHERVDRGLVRMRALHRVIRRCRGSAGRPRDGWSRCARRPAPAPRCRGAAARAWAWVSRRSTSRSSASVGSTSKPPAITTTALSGW